MTDSRMRDDPRALRLVEQHGRTGTAFQVLNPGLSHWFDSVAPAGASADETRGLVAYVDTGDAWVAAGEPVTAAIDAIPVAERFVAAARSAGRRVSFFGTEGILASSPRFRRFPLGEQPVWDPQQWSSHLAAHRSLREQLRRARAKGVKVRRVEASDCVPTSTLHAQLEAVVRHWLAARPMPPMEFLVEVAPLIYLEHRQLYVAERHGLVVGFASLAPVPARDGWLFEHVLRDPAAPNGTAELLVDAAMRSLASENVRWATLGLAPLAGTLPRWLRWIRTLSRPLFNFDGLAAFKRKLRPQHWEPIYLAYPVESSRAIALLDGLRAFAGGALWRFGVRTALRGPRPFVALLEGLLIPWTLLLAVVPTSPWFPSVTVHALWVLFDLALLVLLRAVRTGNWHAGARMAAAAVSLDALLSVWQALAWNAPHLTSAWSAMWVSIACAGPLLTAPTLWGAARRLSLLRDAPSAR